MDFFLPKLLERNFEEKILKKFGYENDISALQGRHFFCFYNLTYHYYRNDYYILIQG